MSGIGHNQGPSNIDFAHETSDALGLWLKENPVIQTEDEARAGKLLIDRAKGSLVELESERDKLVRPLNEQVKSINDTYRGPRESLERIKDILLDRLEVFAKAEKAKREKEAEEKRRAADDAERKARDAEAIEQRLKDDSKSGVCGDVAQASLEANTAFADYQRAEREAARAEKATKVRLTGGFGRALGLRQTEVLSIQNAITAINEMGLDEGLIEAILTAARKYRTEHGRLPHGIMSRMEEGL